MRTDIAQQVASYKGFLEWDAISPYPAVAIELFIKETGIPFRKPKMTEINTIPSIDPAGGVDTRVQAAFWGAPDILQINLSGWMITPRSGSNWDPKSSAGASLSIGNLCYPELVDAYIEGRMKPTTNGAWQRIDPDRYISPHGHQYDKPIIGSFDWNFTTNPRKQQFSMTLWLEK